MVRYEAPCLNQEPGSIYKLYNLRFFRTDKLCFMQLLFRNLYGIIINTYRKAVSPTLDLLCHEDFNVGRSEAESNIEIFMAQ